MKTPPAAVRPSASRLRWWGAAAVLGLLALGGYLGSRWYDRQAERDEALRLAETGHFDAAEPRLLQIQERDPGDADAVRALALGYLKAGRLDDAETHLDRWCELRPGEAEPYRRRLDLWTKRQDGARALADMERILQLDPDDLEVREGAVHLLLTAGRYEEAEREAVRCMDARPDDPGTWYLVARSRFHLGRTAEATALADRLLAAVPDFPGARELRADLYLAAGQTDPAVRLLRQAADVPGRDPTGPLYQLGLALARAGRDDEAKKVEAESRWRRELSLWSADARRYDRPELQARVVEALLAADRTDDAVRFLTDVLRQRPDAAAAHRLLADCYDRQGRRDLAAEHRRRAGPP